MTHKLDLLGINHNDKITCVQMWGKRRLVLATQYVGNFHISTREYKKKEFQEAITLPAKSELPCQLAKVSELSRIG